MSHIRSNDGTCGRTHEGSLLPGAEIFRLARSVSADMMSDMKTFTVRDLDRAPAIVLAACDRDGEARIRRRDGRIYRLMPAAGPKRAITGLPDFTARRRQMFKKPLSAAQTRLADEALRGE